MGDEPPRSVKRWLTIREAAALTPLSQEALRARVDRGSVKSTMKGSRRMIRLEDLYASGLIAMDPAATIGDLLDRLEAAQRRIGQLEEQVARVEAEH